MIKKRIEQKDWINYFEQLNKNHRYLIISVDVTKGKESKNLISELPLKEIDVNMREKDNNIVTVIGGESSPVTHFIDHTAYIEVEETDDNLPIK